MLWALFFTSRNDEKRAWVSKPDHAGRKAQCEDIVAGPLPTRRAVTQYARRVTNEASELGGSGQRTHRGNSDSMSCLYTAEHR